MRGAPCNEQESGRRWEEFVEQAGGSLVSLGLLLRCSYVLERLLVYPQDRLREPVAILIAATISHLPPSPIPLPLSLPSLPQPRHRNSRIPISLLQLLRYRHASRVLAYLCSGLPRGEGEGIGEVSGEGEAFPGRRKAGGGDTKEDRARRNLRMEIEALKSGAAPRE